MFHKTANERYEKLKRVFHRLMQDFSVDDLDDYIAVLNSLTQFIKQDPAMSGDQKLALDQFMARDDSGEFVGVDWQICREIANRQKHFAAPRDHKPFVQSLTAKTGGTGFAVPPMMQVYGSGQEVFFECGSGKESGMAFVIRTFRTFHYIFEVARIPVPERTLKTLTEMLAS